MSPARDVRQLALDYLQQHHVLTLATDGPGGIWAAAVFYVNDGFTLYFLSAGHTRHAQNMQARPRVAAAIHEEYDAWREIKGIQLAGLAALLSGAARATAEALYRTRFPFLNQANPQLDAALARINWYRLTPDCLYFIDNSQGLGHRDEVRLG